MLLSSWLKALNFSKGYLASSFVILNSSMSMSIHIASSGSCSLNFTTCSTVRSGYPRHWNPIQYGCMVGKPS
eukprot:15004_4